jgi:hypothetical protein
MTAHKLELTARDIIKIYDVIEAARTGLPNLTRSQREEIRRLRDRLDLLYWQACQHEATRRAAKDRATERRSARKMPTPTVAEADAWHGRLTSTNPAPTKRGSRH